MMLWAKDGRFTGSGYKICLKVSGTAILQDNVRFRIYRDLYNNSSSPMARFLRHIKQYKKTVIEGYLLREIQVNGLELYFDDSLAKTLLGPALEKYTTVDEMFLSLDFYTFMNEYLGHHAEWEGNHEYPIACIFDSGGFPWLDDEVYVWFDFDSVDNYVFMTKRHIQREIDEIEDILARNNPEDCAEEREELEKLKNIRPESYLFYFAEAEPKYIDLNGKPLDLSESKYFEIDPHGYSLLADAHSHFYKDDPMFRVFSSDHPLHIEIWVDREPQPITCAQLRELVQALPE